MNKDEDRIGRAEMGFTLIELITVMVLIAILAAVAMPKFGDVSKFERMGYGDNMRSVLRYAQKQAIAQRRTVCVTVAVNSVTLTIASAADSLVCNTSLTIPVGTGNVLQAPDGVTSSTAAFSFTPLGQPSSGQSITVSGTTEPVIVETETGYVH